MAVELRRGNLGGVAAGLALGLTLMYVFDPDRGRRRRAMFRDRVVGTWHDLADEMEEVVRDGRNRLRGAVAETGARFRREEVSEPQLAERVRAKLGRYSSHPSSIEVMVQGNQVTLSGPVLAHEMKSLLTGIASVRGVGEVVNRLEPHKTREEIPGLQGGATRTGDRPDVLQTNWAPATRFAAGLAGGTLIAAGVRQGGPVAAFTGALGLGLVARAVTNLELRRLLGVGESRRGIDLHKTITIEAPLDHVYRVWTDVKTFPWFMRNVREVRDLGDGRSAWTVVGPLGMPVRFNAVVTQQEPNRVFAWKSEEGEAVAHAGIVRFQPSASGGTTVDIRLTYKPPAGAAGHLIASLFGADPKREMDEDLLRMKTFLETGKSPHDAAARATQQ